MKKPNGSKPGFVIYFEQKTVFVTPRRRRCHEIKKMKHAIPNGIISMVGIAVFLIQTDNVDPNYDQASSNSVPITLPKRSPRQQLTAENSHTLSRRNPRIDR